MIEDALEAMEREGLGAEGTLGWQRGFDLEGEVHAFVANALLRLAGIDAFEANAEAHPPGRAACKGCGRTGSDERLAIVGADCFGDAVAAEQPPEHSAGGS